jgi:hypothetical protein
MHFHLSHSTMLAPAVLNFINIFDAVGSFIFSMLNPVCFLPDCHAISVHHSNNHKPTFHVQTCCEILSENTHFPTQPDPSVLYAGSQLRDKPDMLRGMSLYYFPTSYSHF